MQKFDLDTKPFTFKTSTAGDLRRRRRTVAITALRKDKATQFLQCLYETLKKLANDLVVVERNSHWVFHQTNAWVRTPSQFHYLAFILDGKNPKHTVLDTPQIISKMQFY